MKVDSNNLTDAIIAYESGDLDGNSIISLFQHLIDSDLAWQLQGSYGRTAKTMIAAGYCHPKTPAPEIPSDNKA